MIEDPTETGMISAIEFAARVEALVAAAMDAHPFVQRVRAETELESDPTRVSGAMAPKHRAPVDELSALREESQLREAALAYGIKPAAVVDFVRRVREERPTLESRLDPTAAPGLDEFAETLRESAPHLFEPRPPRPRGH